MKSRLGYSMIMIVLLLLTFNVAAQSHEDDHDHGEDSHTHETDGATVQSLDTSLFLLEGLASSIEEEPCILSGGTETTCYRIAVYSVPTDHATGPWCPRDITDTAEVGGIWFEEGVVYDLTGEFIENLAEFYNDDNWKLHNDDGSINVTDTLEAFEAAARPNVDPEYQNHCVEGQLSYLEEGATLLTYVIPKTPVMLDVPSEISSVLGVALNGVNFDPPAPVEAILGAYTIAAIDDCGGHVNPVTGYHYHAHTGCITEVGQADDHAPLIGYALDGIGMYALYDEDGHVATNLDSCGGEYDDVRGYHYHVGESGSNQTLGCFSAEVGCTYTGDAVADICDSSMNTGGEQGQGQGQANFASAAGTLGITEAELLDALGTERPPNIEAAALQLGISVDELQAALGEPPRR